MTWDGLLLVHKPFGITSHQVVQKIKERLKASKAGHLGTLDPLATGVFPVCLGKATRLSPFYMGADKCYLATFRFGYFTTTDDREGEQEGPYRKVTFATKDLEDVLKIFLGEYEQTPPLYSAKKVKGKKAYELARRGAKPALPTQKVRIHEIRLEKFEKDQAVVFIHCGSGTYVRSIARELGLKLNCGAHVKELVRTKFNDFSLEQCCAPSAGMELLKASFTPLPQMLGSLPEMTVETAVEKRILSGSIVDIEESVVNDWIRIFSTDRRLLAIGRMQAGDKPRLQPKIVFS